MSKPAKLGTVWTAKAIVYIIDDSGPKLVRKTVARCMDTPNAVNAAVAEARKNGHSKLWVAGEASGIKYIG